MISNFQELGVLFLGVISILPITDISTAFERCASANGPR